MKRIILAALLAAAGTSAVPALARPVSMCRSGGGRSSYVSSNQAGRNAIRTLWDRFGDPLQMEEFFDAVADNLDLQGGSSSFVRCGNLGYVDGVYAELNRIREEVTGQCIDAGAAVGRMTGKLTCAAPNYALFMDAKMGVCTALQRTSCTVSVREYIREHCRASVDDDTLDALIENVCHQITG
jgi:hypothetical protein